MRAAIVAALVCGLAALASASRFTLDTRTYQPSEWKQGNRAAPSLKIKFMVAMNQQNLDVLDQRFWAISTPGTPDYGKFMSLEELNALIGTSAHEMSAAIAEFNAVPGMVCEPWVDAMRCVGSVSSIESLFQTELYSFDNVDDGRNAVVYMGSLSLPASLQGYVHMVEGFSRFPTPFTVAKHMMKANAVDYVIAPESLESIYQFNGAVGSTKVIQSVAEFQSEPSYTPSELPTFAKETGVPKIDIVKKIGPFSAGGDPESSLDIQYISSVGRTNLNWFITEADWLYSFATEFNTATAIPNVISMSYGWYENDQCSIETDPSLCKTSYDYVARVNTEFQKLGARGISLLASSGDSGAHGRTDISCQYNVLRPAYPAASPYVTAVGATMIKAGTGKIGGKSPVCTKSYAGQCAVEGTEIVASCATGALITSGGGFSNVAPRPAYQEAEVKKYLDTKAALPPADAFNATGRGFPDVAALGHNYFIEAGGPGLVDGTSCSAPVWGGVLGLLNGYLAENNKPLLGFANPTLYKIYENDPSAFTDVTEGDNTCTEDTCSCPPGFKAAAGWDAATGLGSPVYPKLLAGLKALKGMN